MAITFSSRHIGTFTETKEMLKEIGIDSLEKLIDETIPENIRSKKALNIPEALSEADFVRELKGIASKNKVFRSYIGMGYYNCLVPAVIQRNLFENPSWYTSYTPYQAEISQGRLESLLNFQTMVTDLTGMQIANASLLDEGTAAAEAMGMFLRIKEKELENVTKKFFVSENCFPQTIDVLKSRAYPLEVELVIGNEDTFNFDSSFFGALIQYPNQNGEVKDISNFIKKCSENNILTAVASDLMSLAVLKPAGELGADVVFGSAQRFGVPLGYGGPHAGFFATKDEYKRQAPGRIIGVSVDAHGKKAYRMSLQTREQHIKRDKATSNICTAQALLANMAAMYAVYHGSEGIKDISEKIHFYTQILENELKNIGFRQLNEFYFDTLKIEVGEHNIKNIEKKALEKQINFRYFDSKFISISLDETVTEQDLNDIVNIFTDNEIKIAFNNYKLEYKIPDNLKRTSSFLKHDVFNKYHSETKMMRYLKYLETKDISLTRSMIPLGSCTMKLNAATEMYPVSWAEFSQIHPFAPLDQTDGYKHIFTELETYLAEITGFHSVSLQPNSGAQGEFAGLLVIKKYFEDNNQNHRNIALIPSSAHGTNPASAIMAGLKVVVVSCKDGAIEIEDLKNKINEHKDNLACLMVTYPSTYGIFEENIKDICQLIHDNGGLVYMDGANMNAQVGLTSPGEIGADVCHLNLHKTFSIPHGGGGPGVGPICVNEKLAPYLPNHKVIKTGKEKGINAVTSAPWGSASILLISYAYIKMLGSKGLTDSTKYAILNANYLKAKLEKHYSILFAGKNGRVAHEMIVDLRGFKTTAKIEAEDVAKRLMDYGFHAPTMSWPVTGTIMIEPTESEDKEELDRFCDAMIQIFNEIKEIEQGSADISDNVLKNSPHTHYEVISDNWNHKYSREKAVYPLPYLKTNKYWTEVGRINNAYGDRNLVCTCPPLEDYV
ncbi:MAG: aminomethyl-transferring glycine dehydrogenase [Candidatus Sericytochromatia bacterium]